MAKTYWVVGGEYADTDFIMIAGGGEPARYGPYEDYEQARREWARLAREHIDDTQVRYTIDNEDARAYWVVGGEYTDTHFSKLANGEVEERYGPFQSYKEAQALWRQMSRKQIENAHVRYRIDHV